MKTYEVIPLPFHSLSEGEKTLIERAIRKAFPPVASGEDAHPLSGIMYMVNTITAFIGAQVRDVPQNSPEYHHMDYSTALALGVLWEKLLATNPPENVPGLREQAQEIAGMLESHDVPPQGGARA